MHKVATEQGRMKRTFWVSYRSSSAIFRALLATTMPHANFDAVVYAQQPITQFYAGSQCFRCSCEYITAQTYTASSASLCMILVLTEEERCQPWGQKPGTQRSETLPLSPW